MAGGLIGKRQFRLLVGLGCTALLLAGADIVLVVTNRTAQNAFNERAQYIQQSLQLEPVYKELIRRLAELSARENDAQLRGLLAQEGITFTLPTPAAQSGEVAEPNGKAAADTEEHTVIGGRTEGGGK